MWQRTVVQDGPGAEGGLRDGDAGGRGDRSSAKASKISHDSADGVRSGVEGIAKRGAESSRGLDVVILWDVQEETKKRTRSTMEGPSCGQCPQFRGS